MSRKIYKYTIAGNRVNKIEMPEIPADTIYPVVCECGYNGTSDDCPYGRCPNCGGRVRRDYNADAPICGSSCHD